MKILMTSGGTREFIDGVRFLGNISSGKTGSLLADEFSAMGHEVVYLHGEDSRLPERQARRLAFDSAQDLENKMGRILHEERFDAVIHLAAVSDYTVTDINVAGRRVKASRSAKINSDADTVTLTLHKNPKILPQIKGFSRGEPMVIGFKLTATDDRVEWVKAVHRIYGTGAVDWVVHNDLSDINAHSHRFRIISRDGRVDECSSVKELARDLNRIIGRRS